MKRTLIITLAFLLLSTFSFGNELTGFLDVKFGTNREEVEKSLKDDGFIVLSSDDTNVNYTKPNYTYFDLPIENIIFTYKNNRFVAGTLVTRLTQSNFNLIFQKMTDIANLYNLKEDNISEGENAAVVTYSSDNKSLIVTISYGYVSFTLSKELEKEAVVINSDYLSSQSWTTSFITLNYDLIFEKDGSFVIAVTGGDIDGMVSGTYELKEDNIYLNIKNTFGKNIDVLFRQKEAYKIEDVTYDSFSLVNLEPLDPLFALPMKFKADVIQ